MQPIAEWLEKLGLGHYTQRFAENGIDLSDLRHLTDQDLKDIGILLGHRRRMLAAIAELARPTTPEPTAATEPKQGWPFLQLALWSLDDEFEPCGRRRCVKFTETGSKCTRVLPSLPSSILLSPAGSAA
jgi:hypothetical protein